jgi:acyl dehydratase
MDTSFIGRSFPLAEPYLVGVEKVREFAAAIGETSPLCHDRAAARAAGYPDLVAPPTFAMAVVARAQDSVLFDPELGLDFSRVVHGDQAFTHHRAICAGDELSATVHIDAIRQMAGNDIITLRTELADVSGAQVSTATSTLVSRGADA